MSNSSTSTIATSVDSVRERAGVLPLATLRKPVEAFAFWAGVTLPFLYVPLALSGLRSESAVVACLALIVLHGVSLFVGRNHRATE